MHVVHMTVEQHVIGDGLKTFPVYKPSGMGSASRKTRSPVT